MIILVNKLTKNDTRLKRKTPKHYFPIKESKTILFNKKKKNQSIVKLPKRTRLITVDYIEKKRTLGKMEKKRDRVREKEKFVSKLH